MKLICGRLMISSKKYLQLKISPSLVPLGHLRLIYLHPLTSLSSFHFSDQACATSLTSLQLNFALPLNNLSWLSENCESGVVQPASFCALSRAEETCATATEH